MEQVKLEKWDDESLSYFGLIFEVGVWARRDILDTPTFDDFKRFGTQKSTEIGVDEKGLFFYATGPVRCYLKDKGITWAFKKEDFVVEAKSHAPTQEEREAFFREE